MARKRVRKKPIKKATKLATVQSQLKSLDEAYKQLQRDCDSWIRRYNEEVTKVARFRRQADQNPLPTHWRTAEQDSIAISQMEDEHLRNSIFYLFRHIFIHGFGSTRFLDVTRDRLLSLVAMMYEAEKRGLRF